MMDEAAHDSSEHILNRRGVLAGGAAAAAVGLGSLVAAPAAYASPQHPKPPSGPPNILPPPGTTPPTVTPPLSSSMLRRIRRGERFRLRELGIVIGALPTGRYNAITDVPGVKVGYKTVIFDKPGIARTGVTIIKARDDIYTNYCYSAMFSHNGNGEMSGSHWVAESGLLTTHIGITNTAQVGIVRDTLVKLESEAIPDLTWALPVVAETWDGSLNDINKFWVTEKDVREAHDSARGGLPKEGNVGGGTAMGFMGWKGGSGTSSRVVTVDGKDYTVGVFVQSNFGSKNDLRVNGAPVGIGLPMPGANAVPPSAPTKSCIIVVATDAPLVADQCRRLAVRAANGLSMVGGVASNGDGDIYMAFSTGNSVPTSATTMEVKTLSGGAMTALFRATIDATQEALLNSATKAETMSGLNGKIKYAIPLEELVGLVRYHRV